MNQQKRSSIIQIQHLDVPQAKRHCRNSFNNNVTGRWPLIPKIDTKNKVNYSKNGKDHIKEGYHKKDFKALRTAFCAIDIVYANAQKDMCDLKIRKASPEEKCRGLEKQLYETRGCYPSLLARILNLLEVADDVIRALIELNATNIGVKNQCFDMVAATEHNEWETTTTTNIKPPQKPKKNKVLDQQNRRTLVIKGVDRLTGKQIEDFLLHNNYATPINVEKVTFLRNHIEVKCKTEENMMTLQTDLGNHQKLNRPLNFVQKALPMQKLILLGILESVDTSKIVYWQIPM